MAMNREQKRLLKKQGELGPDGEPIQQKSAPPSGGRPPATERLSPKEYFGEITTELKKVAWPSRPEVINSALVVIFTLVLVTLLIAVLDWVFGQGSLWLFDI